MVSADNNGNVKVLLKMAFVNYDNGVGIYMVLPAKLGTPKENNILNIFCRSGVIGIVGNTT